MSPSHMPQGTSPYRALWLAVLCAIALAQIVAIAAVARSQVQKGQLRALVERSAQWETDNCPRQMYAPNANAACRLREAAADSRNHVLLASAGR